MIKYVVMDSEYCSMGRWISAIVAKKMNMSLYEGKDLLQFIDDEWLTEETLNALDNKIALMSEEEVKNNKEIKKVHVLMSKAIEKAIEKGPCIIHERAAGDILKGKVKYLKVLLYNTNTLHKIPRAQGDSTYDLKNYSQEELVDFIKSEDLKRSRYRNAVSLSKWGEKETYDICLDSDVLSREKCAEILIETLKDVSLDQKECAEILKESFE